MRQGLLALWCFGLGTILVCWGAWHYPVLPGPVPDELKPIDRLQTAARWTLIHYLDPDCGCSQAVAAYLVQRRPWPGTQEQVWLPTPDLRLQRQLEDAGFQVVEKNAAALETSHRLQAAPWLLIFEPGGQPRYSGGYSGENPRRGLTLEDGRILAQLRSGITPSPLPARGCATAPDLRRAFDPLGLKYAPASPPAVSPPTQGNHDPI